MADIVKSRNKGQNAGPVKVPLYKAGTDARWDGISTMPIVNKVTIAGANGNGKSILSVLAKDTQDYTDLSGQTVTMVTKIGENVYHDVVKLIGCTNNGYVVEIGGEEYTVRRAIARFITGDDVEVA